MNILHLRQGEQLSGKLLVVICILIFLIALGVRVLYWQDNQISSSAALATDPYRETGIMAGMPTHYRDNAQLLLNGDIHTFLYGTAPPTDARPLMHPPGYAIFASLIFKVTGNSDVTLRLVHLILTCIGVVIVFLITANLLRAGIAILAGLLAAFSPQLSSYSVLLRPDILVPIPILLAIYFITRAINRSATGNMLAAGVFLGLSCWLRSDVMLLAPFLAVVVPLLLSSVS